MRVGGGTEEQSDSSRLLETDNKQTGGEGEAESRKASPGHEAQKVEEILR